MSEPDWRDALRGSCAALVDAAQRFAPGPFPRGADGVRALAARLRAHADDDAAGEPEDRAFVEGAGALLGLLLVDHTGGGALVRRDGVARVRVGERGFVDPFAIMEGSLDADRPREALRAALALAEAEVRGEGPFSRVSAAVERCLAESRPALRVQARFEAWLALEDGTELDLRRLVDATRDQPAPAVLAAARKLVAMIPGGPVAMDASESWATLRARVLPRLVPATFDAGPGAPALCLAPLTTPGGLGAAPDIAVAIVVPEGGRARYLRADDAVLRTCSADAVRAQALANLAARSGTARFTRVDTPAGPLIVARTGDGLDAARLLLPGLHAVLATELGSPCAVAVPHRDTLLACAASSPEAIAALAARARDEAARAPHPISGAVLRLGPDGLAPPTPAVPAR